MTDSVTVVQVYNGQFFDTSVSDCNSEAWQFCLKNELSD